VYGDRKTANEVIYMEYDVEEKEETDGGERDRA